MATGHVTAAFAASSGRLLLGDDPGDELCPSRRLERLKPTPISAERLAAHPW